MSMYNEVLAPRYNRLLQKLLSMKGGAPAPQLSGDISAGITLETDRPEWGFLSGEFRAQMLKTRAADAANFSTVGIFNGSTSGVLGVVEGVWIINNTGAVAQWVVRLGCTTALGNVVRALSTDQRWVGKSSTLNLGDNVEAASTGTAIGQYILQVGQSLYVPLNIVLPPNSSVQPIPTNVVVAGSAINLGVLAVFVFRERQLEASEAPAGV